MRPRHKMFWLNPEDRDSNNEFINYLDNGWAPAFYMPTEKNVMIVLWKDTDALEGLSMAVSSTTGTNQIKINKNDKPPK